MADYRNQLKAKLRDKGLDDYAKMVELENGHAGRESSNGDVKDYWLKMLTTQGRGSKLYAEREKHSVAEIERQLMEFPDDLYNTWVNNRDQFVSKVYYMHIPKQVLWGFLSGIAFVEMMREGDKGKDKERSFTLKEIASYCEKRADKNEAKGIVAMLNHLLRKNGTEEEFNLVDSIESSFIDIPKGNTYNAPVGQVIQQVNKIENNG